MNSVIKTILNEGQEGTEYKISAWVRTKRSSGGILFVELNDGSCHRSLQVIVEEQHFSSQTLDDGTPLLAAISTGSCVTASGILTASPAAGQAVEMKATSLALLGSAEASYPLQKKKHGFEFLRSIAHLRSRTNSMKAVARIRHALTQEIHKFFSARNFFHINTPIITGIDAEGGGEVFSIHTEHQDGEKFFGKLSYLTVSGQLHAECYALALGRVYTFGPTFRAENSNTSRHLSEFWMLEPEICFIDIQELAALADTLVRHLVQHILDTQSEDIDFFEQWIEPGLRTRLENIVTAPSKHIPYDEAIQILQSSGEKFEFEPVWGCDLQTEHERYICEKWHHGPVIVYNYPKDIKAFYMRRNDDGRTVAAMDMLIPVFGEIVGGSQREERLEELEQAMEEKHIDKKSYDWYLDLRRYGSAVHSGFGLGFDRLVQYVTGMQNIRDTMPFPRSPGQAQC